MSSQPCRTFRMSTVDQLDPRREALQLRQLLPMNIVITRENMFYKNVIGHISPVALVAVTSRQSIQLLQNLLSIKSSLLRSFGQCVPSATTKIQLIAVKNGCRAGNFPRQLTKCLI